MNGGLGWDGGTGREGSAEKMRSWVRRCCVRTQSLQSCLTLGDATDCSPPGSSSAHGILQARIVEWVTVTSSRGSSWPRDGTHVSRNAGGFFTLWATWEAEWGYRGPNYSLKAEFSPKPVCVNRALVEHHPTCSFTDGLQRRSLSGQNPVTVTEAIWPKISAMWPFRESLLTNGLVGGSGERQSSLCKTDCCYLQIP